MEALRSILKIIRRKAFGVSLVVALMAGVATCCEVRLFMERRTADPRFLVARRDMARGRHLNLLDLTILSGRSGKAPPKAITDQELHLLEGAILAEDVSASTIITWDMLERRLDDRMRLGARVPKGFLAYSFISDNFLQVLPNDRVDIILKPHDSDETPVTIVEGASVLQTSQLEGRLAIVVAVARRQIELLEKASQKGTLTIVLRNPDEAIREPTVTHLFRKRHKRAIQIWSEAE